MLKNTIIKFICHKIKLYKIKRLRKRWPPELWAMFRENRRSGIRLVKLCKQISKKL